MTRKAGLQGCATTRPGRRGFLAGALLAVPSIVSLRARAAAGTTLRYWSFLDPSSDDVRSQAQTQMIAGFTARHPDVTVKIEVVHWSKVVPMLITSAAAGQAPDIALVHSSRIPQAVEAGAIVPITRFVDALPQPAQDDFLEPIAKMRYNGQVWSLPSEHRVEGMLLYRRDLFDKAGIKSPPRTWAEVADVARKLQQPHVWGLVWALSRQDAAANVKMLMTEYWAAGGDFFNADGSAAVNSPAGLRLAETITDLARNARVMPDRIVGVEDSRSMMKGGTTAMLIEGTQVFDLINSSKTVAGSLASAPMPTLQPGQYPPDALLAGQTLAVSKDCQAPEVAWSFIEHMTSPEAQLISAKVGGNVPVRGSCFADPFFATKRAAELVSWRDYIRTKGRPFLVNTLSDYMADSLGLAYEEILTGGAAPQAALDAAAARYNERKRSSGG
jgi:multiple sugar transport system substrate-binding protein